MSGIKLRTAGGGSITLQPENTGVDVTLNVPADNSMLMSAADLAAGSGSSLVGYTPAGTGAVATTVQAKLRKLEISDSDFPTLQQAIDSLQPGQRFNISGDHTISAGLTITNKSRIRITGKGRISLSGAASSDYIFQLVGVIDDLEIDGLTLVGENNPAYSQCAIGCNSGQTVSNTRFHDLNIYKINVGISHNAYSGGSWTRGLCYNNFIKDLPGTSPGQGYGIHIAKAKYIQVYDNIIDNASRHGIYQGAGISCNNIITNNVIANHRSTVATGTYRCAISCARSTGVTISNNRIVDFCDGGLEIAHDTVEGLDCANILVSGNSFINRKNGVPAVLIGEQLVPTTRRTYNVELVKNEFDEDVTLATGTTIYIVNGNQIRVSNNRFRRYNVTTTISQVLEIGSSSYATSDAHISDVTVTDNDATADNAVAGSRFAYISTQLCTGASSYTVKNNNLTGFSKPFEFQATPTNVNSKLKFQVRWTNDFASVAANSTFGGAYNPTVFQGMKPTSMVTVRPQQSINSRMAFNMFPSDTGVNTLYVWLFNTTAGAIDWPSTTFIVNVEDI